MPQQQIDPVELIASQMAQTGMMDPTRSQPQRQKSPLEEQLAALVMAERVKPSTSLGFLLGQIAGGGLQSWAENYSDRDFLKNKLLSGTPEYQQEILSALKQTDPKKYMRMLQLMSDRGISAGTSPQTASQPSAQPQATAPAPQQPDTTGINSDTTLRLAQGLFGGDNPLEKAADPQFESLPEAPSIPFHPDRLWEDENNWNQYAQYANILSALQRR